MKFVIAALALLISNSAFSAVEWKSTYTNLETDCVVVSKATDKAEIDFYDAECKSFGGYQLFISGGDLRYGPKLTFAGQELSINVPGAFHDTASKNVEWLYTSEMNEAGEGKIQWRGFIYRLSVADVNGRDRKVLYAVRLDGSKTCDLGEAVDNNAARELVKKSKTNCR